MNPARRTTRAATTALVLATTGALLSTAPPAASAATTCAAPAYQRQSFANTTFSGTPKKTDCDSTIAENWGAGSPATGLPKDNFGIRWTVTRDFGSGGPFALTAATQDGIRVYVDGNRKIDLWRNVSTTVRKTVNVTIPSGKHTLRIDYANWTGNANITFAYTPRTSATVDRVAPLTPAAVSASYDKRTRKTTVKWSRNKELDLAGYRVYRRLKDSNTWKRLTATSAVTYIDATPATGDTYFYEVRAVDRAGTESVGTADKPVTSLDRTAPVTPSGVKAADEQPGVTVSWNSVPGAVSYIVHREWQYGDYPVKVATVTSTAWTDVKVNEAQSYAYWVTAVDKAGNQSARSAPIGVERGDFAPSAPGGLTAGTTATGIALKWQAPTVPNTGDLSGYLIYRDGRLIKRVAPHLTSYTDLGLQQGVTYRYTVTAVDQFNESVESKPATATAPATGLAPAPVKGLRGAMNGTDIELFWERSPEDDVDIYHVYRGVLVEGVWQYDRWTRDYGIRQPADDEPLVSYIQDIYYSEGETVRWAVVAVDRYDNSLFDTGKDFSYVTVTEPVSPPETAE
ncbi:cellulose 1,4-beta-cellobiosidase family protein [Streptomyces sp. NRRL WC-3618]|uniref:fibronectin type III domain-containing protein n=1 Tax=Streptomyces sp. NRRL WC-3618 TaxID=1519490 RepID=UPI0006AF85C4|nr:PA14 domain-containing protein [Streptomyces sp. NRRL WC-3618]KOV61220.1 cellulose 1,4-beta-cellobiosidase family protein [Streptomyces sp. NRRL WC-3618]